MIKTILPMIPPHRIYCEPFFGGGAVFFAKGPSYLEAINDINDNLITFYKQVQTNFDALKERIKNTLHSETEWKKARKIWLGADCQDIDKAWAVWMLTNVSFSGSPDGGWKWCNGSGGSHSGRVMRNKRDSFTDALYERLKDVQISCRDALLCIEQRDTPETFFYLDPPYPGSEQKHYRGFSEDNLEELLHSLESLKGKFILSQFMTATLEKYIEKNRWNYKSVDMNMNVANFDRNGGGKRRKLEVLVYNFETEKSLFDL